MAKQQRFTAAARLLMACLVGLLGLAGCDDLMQPVGSSKSSSGSASSSDDESAHWTAAEKAYAKVAAEFAGAMAKGDHAAAHALGASYFKSAFPDAAALAKAEVATFEKFGKPTGTFHVASVNTDQEDLLGPDHEVPGEEPLDANIRKLGAHRAVGDIPASVPKVVRRASVVVEVVRDPRTIPDFDKKSRGEKAEDLKPEEYPRSYLTIVIVEEDGQPRIGYHFHRWPDILD